jgi:hypothetical protein
MTSLYDLSECFRRVQKHLMAQIIRSLRRIPSAPSRNNTGTRATARTFVNDFGGPRRQPVVQYPILTLMATHRGNALQWGLVTSLLEV